MILELSKYWHGLQYKGATALSLIQGGHMKRVPTPPIGICLKPNPPVLPPELEEISALLARMEQPINWFGMDTDKLQQLSWIALTSFRDDVDDRLAEIVGPIYLGYRDSASIDERAAFIDRIAEAVASGSAAEDALLMLCLLEDEPVLIARAAMFYTDARGIAEGDPIPTTDFLLASWEEDDAEHRAGVFLGLLVLGDPAILGRIRPRRVELTDDEVGMISDATITNPCYTTVEFTLEWLEETQANRDHGKFAMLASAITPVRMEDEEADEPPRADGASAEISADGNCIPDDCYFPIAPLLLGKHLTRRLMVIAEQETGSRVMPAVLEAYGLEPVGEAN